MPLTEENGKWWRESEYVCECLRESEGDLLRERGEGERERERERERPQIVLSLSEKKANDHFF